jgi:hypothetical protein
MTTDPVAVGELVNAPNHRKRVILDVDQLLRLRLDIGHSDSVNPRQGLRQRHDPPHRLDMRRHGLPGDDVAVARGADRHLRRKLRARQILVANAMRETDEIGHDVPQ